MTYYLPQSLLLPRFQVCLGCPVGARKVAHEFEEELNTAVAVVILEELLQPVVGAVAVSVQASDILNLGNG